VSPHDPKVLYALPEHRREQRTMAASIASAPISGATWQTLRRRPQGLAAR